MYVRFTVSGQEKIRASIVAKLDVLSDLAPLLTFAGTLARDIAVMRIRQEGADVDPPWIPSKKTQTMSYRLPSGAMVTIPGHGKTGTETRNMANSIEFVVDSSSHVKVGTNVPYARWFQEGTGVYAGHDAWTIRPREKRVLRWEVGGVVFFAREVHAQGQVPRPFLFLSEENVRAILAEWAKRLGKTVS